MHNPYRGGTPDVWYSGKADCWIEYKWSTAKGVLTPDLSPLQLSWLTKRDEEGRTVFVVVGSPGGAAWLRLPKLKDDRTRLGDRAVADLIALVTT